MKSIPKLFVLACLAVSVTAIPVMAETAVAPEISPPGDIPDNQVFVTFSSPLGYSIKVPEGWARSDEGAKTIFSDKYNHILLQLSEAGAPVDEAFARSTLIPDLQKDGRALDRIKVKTIPLKSGAVIALDYDSNSDPNAVTNKQIREENEAVYFESGGKRVTLTLSAPKGADNVDQWNFMVNSFRWK